MIAVTTTTPAGNQRTSTVAKRRDAGRIIAYTLADNTTITRQNATKLAMQAEKIGSVESHGYSFSIAEVTA